MPKKHAADEAHEKQMARDARYNGWHWLAVVVLAIILFLGGWGRS